MADDIAIKVDNVSKTFILPHQKNTSIKSAFLNFYKRKKGYEKQQVLDNISFEVKKGEFFGIVGRNGSGKSTLLKLLAGIYTPDSGDIQINGKLTPFIELGVGFNPELSGRENVFLNGALLGFNRKEMEAMYDEIVAFAELERFMDQKLKNYSSGMQVRLAFSIAIRANTDILVLDEVLAVGDEAFQRKCFQYFAKLKRDNKTVILVTHDMDSVQRFCNKAVMIEKGKIVEQGDAARVSQRYRELFIQERNKGVRQKDGSIVNKNVNAKVNFRSENGEWIFDIKVRPKKPIYDCVLAMILFKQDGSQIWNWASDYNGKNLPDNILGKDLNLVVTLEDIFPSDIFYLNLYIRSKDRSNDYAAFENIIQFEKQLPIDYHQYDEGWQPRIKLEIKNER